MTKLLIVCTANICRSPMAQVVAEKLAKELKFSSPLTLESAGTHASLVAERIDPRALAALARHGYEAGRRRSRKLSLQDLQDFDWILPMDSRNLADLQRLCPQEHLHKLRPFLSYAPDPGEAGVPDPYYGNARGFDNVIQLCELGAKGWLEHLSRTSPSEIDN